MIQGQEDEHASVLGSEARGSHPEAVDVVGGAVEAGGEGGEVARFEGFGGVSEEGCDRGGAVVGGGEPQGGATVVIGGAQRQRVLADQELEHGGVAV